MECDHREGKLMLVRRITTILPAMTLAEASGDASSPRRRPTGDRTNRVTTCPSRTPPSPLGCGAIK